MIPLRKSLAQAWLWTAIVVLLCPAPLSAQNNAQQQVRFQYQQMQTARIAERQRYFQQQQARLQALQQQRAAAAAAAAAKRNAQNSKLQSAVIRRTSIAITRRTASGQPIPANRVGRSRALYTSRPNSGFVKPLPPVHSPQVLQTKAAIRTNRLNTLRASLQNNKLRGGALASAGGGASGGKRPPGGATGGNGRRPPGGGGGGRGSKPVNLPSVDKVTVNMPHVLSGHTETGNRVQQGKVGSLFPSHWSENSIEKAIKDAYANCRTLQTQIDPKTGTTSVLVEGHGNGIVIQMWLDKNDNSIKSAWPVY